MKYLHALLLFFSIFSILWSACSIDTSKDKLRVAKILSFSSHGAQVLLAEWNAQSDKIVSSDKNNKVIVWDVSQNKKLFTKPGWKSHFSHDGKKLVVMNGNTLNIIDVDNGHEVSSLEGHTEQVVSAAFSPDDKLLYSSSYGGLVKIWNAHTNQEMFSLNFGSTNHFSAFSPDTKRLATQSVNYSVTVWNPLDGTMYFSLRTLHNFSHDVENIPPAFSSDGQKIIAASLDKNVSIFQAIDGKEIVTLRGHDDWAIFADFSPDNKKIISLTKSGVAKIWNAQTGKELLDLSTTTPKIDSVRFSPDSRMLVVTHNDNVAKILDIETGALLLTLSGHTATVNYAEFSPDGKKIVSASDDKTVIAWFLDEKTH